MALLPGLNDLYQAAEFSDSEVNRLVLVMGKDGFRIGRTAKIFLQYMYIGTVELGFTAEGQIFHFVVSDMPPKRVTVFGDRLERIADSLSLRRLHWIRQADPDFRAPASGGDAIITRIDIREWQPGES
jgi:hypothetical protein